MTSRKFARTWLTGLLLLGFSGSSLALSVPPPFPGLAPDIDGNGLFRPPFRETIAVEAFDFLDGVIPPTGSEFGFYFAGDPSSLIPIFEADDLPGQAALINFRNGTITDQDTAVVDLFTPRQPADIGFYWRQPVAGGLILYSQAELNAFGTDVAAEFPYLSDRMTWAIVFGIPLGPGTSAMLSVQVLDPLIPSPIPIPGAAGLWLLGLGGLAWFRRRLKRTAV